MREEGSNKLRQQHQLAREQEALARERERTLEVHLSSHGSWRGRGFTEPRMCDGCGPKKGEVTFLRSLRCGRFGFFEKKGGLAAVHCKEELKCQFPPPLTVNGSINDA